jgi:hypothetical protein
MDLVTRSCEPGHRTAAAKYLVIGMWRYDKHAPEMFKTHASTAPKDAVDGG